MNGHVRFGNVAAAAALLGMLVSFPEAAVAQSASANLAVTATVSTNCTISTTPLDFGTYDPVVTHAAAALESTGTVVVACTKGETATVGLGYGNNSAGATRRMKDPGPNRLTYELYQDAARTAIWGPTGAAMLTLPAAPSKAPRSFTVYGRIPSGQDVPAGGYTDIVVATVNF